MDAATPADVRAWKESALDRAINARTVVRFVKALADVTQRRAGARRHRP